MKLCSQKRGVIASFLSLVLVLVFLTATARSAVRFVVIADNQDLSGIALEHLSEIAQAIIAEEADFVLVAGDLTWPLFGDAESKLLQWRQVMQPVYDANIRVYPVRVNHDADANETVWNNVFSGMYAAPDNGPVGEKNLTYSFTYRNIFVAGLDEYVTPHRVNQGWLDQQFALNNRPHVFVFGHEPAFKLHHQDCLDDSPDARNAFWESIKAEGARVYFCGHEHCYDRARIDDGDGNAVNDLYQIVTTGGVQFFYADGPYDYDGDNQPYEPCGIYYEPEPVGYLRVDVNNVDVTMNWKHRVAPNQFVDSPDAFSYTVSLGPADFDSDGQINMKDFAVLAAAWRTKPADINWNPACDISHPNDDIIDELDLDVFTDRWLSGSN
ncbi:MAG: metallophosphoesterase family protein [Planctomycetota bacterium]|jgi:hypothetical protein